MTIKKQNKTILWVVGIIIFLVAINNGTFLGSVERVIVDGCINPCPSKYRCTDYTPIPNPPSNFVTAITEGGNQCVIKESEAGFDIVFNNPQEIEDFRNSIINNCEDVGGFYLTLDGVIITGGYNLPGEVLDPDKDYSDLPFCFNQEIVDDGGNGDEEPDFFKDNKTILIIGGILLFFMMMMMMMK